VDVLVDTNVILRSIHRKHPHHRAAREAITRITNDGNRICVASQNLVELWAVCTRPIENNGFALAPGQADRVLARVEGAVFRLPDSDAIYTEWRRLVVTHGVSGKKAHDARLVAAMNVHRVTHILTFNVDDFSRYSDIQVIRPTSTS
jgi:predicted nucleic acid-binding protein